MLLYRSILYSKVLSEKSRARIRPFHARCAPSLFQWIPKLCLNIHRRCRVILVILNSGYRADVRISRRRSRPGMRGKSARDISLQKRFSLGSSDRLQTAARDPYHIIRAVFIWDPSRAQFIFSLSFQAGWALWNSFSCTSRLSLYLHVLFSFDAHTCAAAPRNRVTLDVACTDERMCVCLRNSFISICTFLKFMPTASG